MSFKKLISKGGVEFIAVFLGIALSLWVDDWREEKEIITRLQDDYKKIHSEIKKDIINLDNIITLNKKHINTEEYLLSVINKEEEFNFSKVIRSIDSLDSPTFFGNQSAYNSSLTSGRINISKKPIIVSEIALLYEHFYKRLTLNGDILDKRIADFNRLYSIEFFKPIYKQTGVDTLKLKDYFHSDKFHNGLLIFHDFRSTNYISRLNQTMNQIKKVDSLLNNLLAHN
tara:strand:+ start:322 stop:1005 length:684 start_codon:yes stop_codon:yes gene_type:complete